MTKAAKTLAMFSFALLACAAGAQPSDVDALSDAASRGDVAAINALRIQGVSINAPNYLGWTPLYRAVLNGRKETVQLLLDAGGDANAKNKDGFTPLFAVPEGREDLAELLLAKGADVNAVNESGWTPLLWAAYEGERKERIALWLLAKGAKANAKNRDGMTALHLAVNSGSKPLSEALLAHGAEVNAKGDTITAKQVTPLHLAVEKGDAALVDMLLAKGADINARQEKGLTPLMLALYRKHTGIAESLLAKGADARLRSKSGETALHVAATYGTLAMVERLLDQGADVNAETDGGGSPLDAALFHAKEDVAALLKARGAIVERYRCTSTNSNGATRGSIHHGPCPSPSDQRELLPEQPAQPKANTAIAEPASTQAPAERAQARELVRCTSPDGKSSTLQRGKCAAAGDTQTAATPVSPVLPRSPGNTQVVRCTSPDGKRVSIQRGNCASPDDIQQLLQLP